MPAARPGEAVVSLRHLPYGPHSCVADVEAILSLPALILLAVLGTGSVKVTSGGRSRLVERLGKFDRELQPGLSLVLPVVEKVVSHESLKERVLDIPPQQCITPPGQRPSAFRARSSSSIGSAASRQ